MVISRAITINGNKTSDFLTWLATGTRVPLTARCTWASWATVAPSTSSRRPLATTGRCATSGWLGARPASPLSSLRTAGTPGTPPTRSTEKPCAVVECGWSCPPASPATPTTARRGRSNPPTVAMTAAKEATMPGTAAGATHAAAHPVTTGRGPGGAVHAAGAAPGPAAQDSALAVEGAGHRAGHPGAMLQLTPAAARGAGRLWASGAGAAPSPPVAGTLATGTWTEHDWHDQSWVPASGALPSSPLRKLARPSAVPLFLICSSKEDPSFFIVLFGQFQADSHACCARGVAAELPTTILP